MNGDCLCFPAVVKNALGQPVKRTCQLHPPCACGCPRSAHANEGIGECKSPNAQGVALRCHGCPEYRPARARSFVELRDDELDALGAHRLREVYRELRAHHIEETTVLARRARRFPAPVLGHEDPMSKDATWDRFLRYRGLDEFDAVCDLCSGTGVRTYSNSSGWRKGVGGASMTRDVCDLCWGSGNRERPWRDLRKLDDEVREQIAERAVDALANSCGAHLAAYDGGGDRRNSTKHSVRQIIAHLDALKRKRKVGNEEITFWMLPLANGLRNLLARAIGDAEVEWR